MRNGILLMILMFFPFVINGQEKEWLIDKDSLFTSITSEHFKLFSVEGHISKTTKLEFLNERELAYLKISGFFKIEVDSVINIFLFENEDIKYNVTGHKGLGWGFDNTIVEVFNDSIHVDPYHELVHIIGYTLNKPPALIDEGTAVYLSQLYGNKAFSRLIGYPKKSINEILLLLNDNVEMINISTLLSYYEIDESENVVLAYCQSASFVDFLIEKFGRSKFLELYKSLSSSDIANNEMIFLNIYGKTTTQIENDWIKQVRISN